MGTSKDWILTKAPQYEDLSHGSKLGTKKKKSNWKVLWKCCDLRDEKASACGEEEEYYAGKNDETQNMMEAAIAILPGNTSSVCEPYPAEDMAAIRIQTAFRGFLARRALSVLRSLMRLHQEVMDNKRGQRLQRQQSNESSLRSVQAFVRMQARIHTHRALKKKEEEEGHPIQLPKSLCHTIESRLADTEGWCDSIGTMEEIEAKVQRRQEAAIKRERAMAYAFSNQWRVNAKLDGRSLLYYELGNSTWSWIWLDHWISGSSPPCVDNNHHQSKKSEENNTKHGGITLEGPRSSGKTKRRMLHKKQIISVDIK